MEIDPFRLAIFAIATAILILTLIRFVVGVEARLLMGGLLVGFTIWSGIGTTYLYTPFYLMISYFLMAFAMVGGFFLGSAIFSRAGKALGERSINFFEGIDTQIFATIIIASFFIIKLFNLIYPTFRLHLLINPPSPDIYSWFAARFEESDTVASRFAYYFEVLLTPFFYISLYFVRRRIIILASAILIIRYLEFVDAAYMPRGTVMADALIITLIAWQEKKRWRPFIVIGAIASLPSILYLLGEYITIRAGGNQINAGLIDGALNVLDMETSFLPFAGVQVIESGQTVNLFRYLTWIFTLPLPEFLKSKFPIALVNYEISSLVLGLQPGDRGFYVLLSGLLAESYYLFGQYFFWVHGLFCGFIAGVLARMLERAPCYRVLCIYLAVVFLHNLNRGGIAATLPGLINGFLAFYLFLFLLPSSVSRHSFRGRP